MDNETTDRDSDTEPETETETETAKPTGPEWLAQFAQALGGEAPDEATIAVLLDLAGEAAHASERIAAPIACYLVGRLGLDPADGLARARSLG